jgi:malate dehydrogenase (oxaloacetate-decarboxylating)(NADP+)
VRYDAKTMTDRDAALDYHARGRPGKIEVVSTKPVGTQDDLALAYSPGVAEPCREIQRDPALVDRYTARGNLVAVVSNGTAVLGLGDIGPCAAKPVMEGKGVLFKQFADIDVFDIEVDEKDPDRFVDVVRALWPTFGGINLEDIAAPACFYIEKKLQELVGIPVFHDDQHGTAIISAAGLLNAAHIVGKELSELRVACLGAGASAVACMTMWTQLGVQRENIVVCNSKGVLREGGPGADEYRLPFAAAADDPRRTWSDAIADTDVLIGLSVGNVVTEDMLRTMRPRPIIFALANPDPEIPYDRAVAARPDAIVATGRSDFPNQVNNVLGFPYIFRGALDVRAISIHPDMKRAAVHALAELAREPVPLEVRRAYGGGALSFGPTYIIPTPFDRRALYRVAPAVARAAIEAGVARVDLDIAAYQQGLRQTIEGPSRGGGGSRRVTGERPEAIAATSPGPVR